MFSPCFWYYVYENMDLKSFFTRLWLDLTKAKVSIILQLMVSIMKHHGWRRCKNWCHRTSAPIEPKIILKSLSVFYTKIGEAIQIQPLVHGIADERYRFGNHTLKNDETQIPKSKNYPKNLKIVFIAIYGFQLGFKSDKTGRSPFTARVRHIFI